METIPRLKDAQVGILFQLAGLMANSEFGDDLDNKLFNVAKAAFQGIDREFRKLPTANYVEQGVEFNAYDTCEFDGMNVDFHGKLAWGVYFTSSMGFKPEQLAELKPLCVRIFNEAAAHQGVECVYVGIKAHNTYEYSEEKDLEVA